MKDKGNDMYKQQLFEKADPFYQDALKELD
jgi:hypothetical protein